MFIAQFVRRSAHNAFIIESAGRVLEECTLGSARWCGRGRSGRCCRKWTSGIRCRRRAAGPLRAAPAGWPRPVARRQDRPAGRGPHQRPQGRPDHRLQAEPVRGARSTGAASTTDSMSNWRSTCWPSIIAGPVSRTRSPGRCACRSRPRRPAPRWPSWPTRRDPQVPLQSRGRHQRGVLAAPGSQRGEGQCVLQFLRHGQGPAALRQLRDERIS